MSKYKYTLYIYNFHIYIYGSSRGTANSSQTRDYSRKTEKRACMEKKQVC